MEMSVKDIMLYCLNRCKKGSFLNVEKCRDDVCAFWKSRLGIHKATVQTFRGRCLQCAEKKTKRINKCADNTCPVYPYVFKKRGNKKKTAFF